MPRQDSVARRVAGFTPRFSAFGFECTFDDEVGGVLFVIGSLGDNTFICKTILVILWCLCFVQ